MGMQFKTLFPDSDIAVAFKCGKDKTSCIIAQFRGLVRAYVGRKFTSARTVAVVAFKVTLADIHDVQTIL